MGEVIATYRLETRDADLHKRAESIAVGLTVGTWTDLPAVKQERMRERLGRVVGVEAGPPDGRGVRTATIRIGYPSMNFRPSIPEILTTVFGKLSLDGVIRLADLTWTPDVEAAFPGPKFGIDGIRELLGVGDRPLVMSIFKSCMGLSTAEFAAAFAEQAAGGVDLVKDDEIFFADDEAPWEERIARCREVIEDRLAKTGQRVLYAANLSGPVDELADKAAAGIRAGATAFLLNVLPYGYGVLERLAADPRITVPLIAHPAFSGALFASPATGVAPAVALGKLMRLAGADAVLFPSPYGSVVMDREDALAVADALRSESSLRRAWPGPAAGVHPGIVPRLWKDFGRDQILNAGGGIHGHPGGIAAGGRAMRQAVEWAMQGRSLREGGLPEELRLAVEKWGVVE